MSCTLKLKTLVAFKQLGFTHKYMSFCSLVVVIKVVLRIVEIVAVKNTVMLMPPCVTRASAIA